LLLYICSNEYAYTNEVVGKSRFTTAHMYCTGNTVIRYFAQL